MTATQEISRRILSEVSSGKEITAAIDAVLGVGTYDSLVSDLYAKLRSDRYEAYRRYFASTCPDQVPMSIEDFEASAN